MSSSTLIAQSQRISQNPAAEQVAKTVVVVTPYLDWKARYSPYLGLLLLIGLSPVLLVCIALVRVTSRGPAFYRQVRLGKDGKPFKIIKLRSMYIDAEKLSGPMLCKPGDSRITPLGKVFRFLHLDEIPQLINVVRGEMCLIGPRPERPEIIERNRLREIVPEFDNRMRVRPGITGLAQINLPADESALSVIPKVKLDIGYIKTATLGLDLRILACTAMRMIGIRYGLAVRLFRLQRDYGTAVPGNTDAPEKAARPRRKGQHLVDTVVDCQDTDVTIHAEPRSQNGYATVASDHAAQGSEYIDLTTEIDESSRSSRIVDERQAAPTRDHVPRRPR